MPLSIPHIFTAKTRAKSVEVNENFDAIADLLNITKLDESYLDLASIIAAIVAAGGIDGTDGRLKQTTGLVAGTTLSLSGSYQDVPSATVTFTPDVACYALVTATFTFYAAKTEAWSTNFDITQLGTLTVDGVAQSATADRRMHSVIAAAGFGGSATVTQVYRVALTAAAHTLKLQARHDESLGGIADSLVQNARFSYSLVAQ